MYLSELSQCTESPRATERFLEDQCSMPLEFLMFVVTSVGFQFGTTKSHFVKVKNLCIQSPVWVGDLV